MEMLLILAFSLIYVGVRTFWISRGEGERWARYRTSFSPTFALYLLIAFWGLGNWLLLLLFVEGAVAAGSYIYSEGYKSLFVPSRAWRAFLREAERVLGPATLHYGEEQSPILGTSIRFPAAYWSLPMEDGVEVGVWAFPHAALKETGGRWWVPSLPRGVAALLRAGGKERDILLFPLASFFREGFTYTGRQYVGVGDGVLAQLPAYLHLEALIRHRAEMSYRRKGALLEALLRELPGWRGWAEVVVEGHGEMELYLVPEEGRSVGILLVRREGEVREATDRAERMNRLLGIPLWLWRVEEGPGEQRPLGSGIALFRGSLEGMADLLRQMGAPQ